MHCQHTDICIKALKNKYELAGEYFCMLEACSIIIQLVMFLESKAPSGNACCLCLVSISLEGKCTGDSWHYHEIKSSSLMKMPMMISELHGLLQWHYALYHLSFTCKIWWHHSGTSYCDRCCFGILS